MVAAVKIKLLAPNAQVPQYATGGAACFDLHAYLDEPVVIRGGEAVNISTKLAFEVPDGYVMLVFSRSGHGFKNDLRLSNCVGVIDSDYRGEVMVKLRNDGEESFTVHDFDRIAQCLVIPYPRLKIVKVSKLSDTERGQNGFGSTGK
jgi:dUTP pyrophosphatase